jgi:hypothetical protein
MSEVVELTVQLIGSVYATLRLLRWDTSRLPDRMRARAWPESSMLSASLAFAPLCLVLHFTRTRRSFKGLGLGLLAMLATSVLVSLTSALCAWLIA